MKRAIGALGAVVLTATAAIAEVPAASKPAPAATVTKGTKDAPAGVALGLELGEPTSLTAAWFTGKLVVAGALGTNTLTGLGMSFHADAQLEVARLAPDLPLRIGLGGRYLHHGYQPMSLNEIPDSHYGVRASITAALERPKMQLYAELAPGVDLKRTGSCSFIDGAGSLCPHAQASPVFVQFVVGVRWFLSH